MLGHGTGFNERSRDRMDNGLSAHERVTKKIEGSNALVKGGLRVTEFYDGFVSFEDHMYGSKLKSMIAQHGIVMWTGEADLVVARPGNERVLYVGEIKTANSRKFQALPKQVVDKEAMAKLMWRAEKGYTRQLTQYVVVLQRFIHQWRPDVTVSDEAFFYFENTDNQDYRIIWIRPDETLREDAFKNANLAIEASARGELIERPFSRDSRTCGSCYRKRVCDAIEDGDRDEWTNVKTALSTLKADGLSSRLWER